MNEDRISRSELAFSGRLPHVDGQFFFNNRVINRLIGLTYWKIPDRQRKTPFGNEIEANGTYG